MAWEKLGSTKLALPDSSFSEDFSGSVTYTNNGAYTVSSTVSNAWNASIANTGHTGAETTIDTGVTIDGGSFIMDYSLKADNITNYVFFWLGLGSVTGAGYEDSQNFVGSLITLQGSASNGDIRGGYKNSSATWSGGTNSAGNYFPAGTTRYCRLVKDGTTITSYVYPTAADRTAGTNATTSSAKTSSPATLSGLRYLQILVSNYNDGKTNTATIDDITIYSGVSTAAADTITVDSGTTATATLSDDFTGTDDWTDSDSSNTGVNTTTDLIDFTIDSSADTTTYDLTTVSNTAWVLRFKVKWLTKNTNTYATFGISDNTSAPNVSQDIISIQWRHEGASKWYGSQDTDGSAPNSVARDNEVAFDPTTSTDYYFEIVRQTATTYIVRRYSDSTYGTVSDSASGTCASTTQTLRYIKFAGWTDCSATSTAEIDDVKFYNNITAVTSGKKHLMVHIHTLDSGNQNPKITFNSDTGSNYAYRYSSNGGTDITSTSQSGIYHLADDNGNKGIVCYIINEASKEKLIISHSLFGATGAGNAPNRMENVAKWANTSDQITTITLSNEFAGDFATGSEVTVYGTD